MPTVTSPTVHPHGVQLSIDDVFAALPPEPHAEAKRVGQEQALSDLDPDFEDVFMAAIRAIPAGREFSVNDIRPTLDDAGIPDKARPGLMRRACARGLAEKLYLEHNGRPYPKKVPSTGASAHSALVQAYRRPTVHPEGR